MNMYRVFYCAVLMLACIAATNSYAQVAGSFQGSTIIEPLGDGRNLRVVQPFSFIDSEGREWRVPEDTVTDGASVPRFLWSVFPPFAGKYRIAAIVHDHFCQTRKQSWRAVHRMFYDAMITSGVDLVSARTMYAAVYSFGPRWTLLGITRAPTSSVLSDEQQAEAFKALQQWIEREQPTRQEIEDHIKATGLRQLGASALE